MNEWSRQWGDVCKPSQPTAALETERTLYEVRAIIRPTADLWWRTGLAGIAAGFGVGRVLPEVLGGTNWPYIALGTALAAAGLAVPDQTDHHEPLPAGPQAAQPSRPDMC